MDIPHLGSEPPNQKASLECQNCGDVFLTGQKKRCCSEMLGYHQMYTETHHSSISRKRMIRRFPSRPQFSNQESTAIDVIFCGARQLGDDSTLAVRPFMTKDFHARMERAANRHLQFPGFTWECLVQNTFQGDFHE